MTRTHVSVLPLALLLVCGLVAHAESKKTYFCVRLSGKPILDGRIHEDPAWQGVTEQGEFVKLGAGAVPAEKQTSVRIGYTPDALYIGVVCREPDVENLKTGLEDMGPLCVEDSVELFFVPEGAPNYFHFVVSAAGSRWNGIGYGGPTMPLWDGWQAVAYRGDNHYSLEVRIPWEVLRTIPETREEWALNVCRNSQTSGTRHSTWAHLVNGFHDPDRFGRLVFGGAISSDEGMEARDRVVALLREALLADVQLLAGHVNGGVETPPGRIPCLEKETALFVNMLRRLKGEIAEVGGIREARRLTTRTRALSRRAVLLEEKILLQSFFHGPP